MSTYPAWSAALALALAAGACKSKPAASDDAPAPSNAAIAAVALDLEDVSGLSGLAADERGALWTVPERRAVLIRLGTAGATLAIEGMRPGLELESLAWLGPGRFAIGTEGECAGNASTIALVDIATAEPGREHARVRAELPLAHDPWGATCNPGHGLEGLCFAGSRLLAVLEEVQTAPGSPGHDRLAPVALIDPDPATFAVQPLWLRLSSAKGKISGVECRMSGDAIEVLAIERHFEASRVLRFLVPTSAPAQEPGAAAGAPAPTGASHHGLAIIEPEVVLDLAGYTSGGRRNFEGLVWRGSGEITLIVDNHWRTITGPNELVTIALPDPHAASPTTP